MHNEKPNNPLAEKLDGMNSLPEGFGFSANRVWDQLENQLQDKKRKPMRWLRYAAAIVLLAGAALYWILQKDAATTKEVFSKQSTKQAPINTPTSIPSAAVIIATTAKKILEPKTIHQQGVLVSEKSMATNNIEPLAIAQVPTTIPIETSPIRDTVQPITTIAAAVNSPTPTTKPTNKSVVVRKKYPVVHLYELYKEPEPSYTKSAPKRPMVETDENPIAPTETNRSFWLPKPKPVIITSLTDNQ